MFLSCASFSASAISVEGHLHAFVTDGVEAKLKAGIDALFGHLVNFPDLSGQAGVLGIIGVGLQ